MTKQRKKVKLWAIQNQDGSIAADAHGIPWLYVWDEPPKDGIKYVCAKVVADEHPADCPCDACAPCECKECKP